MTSRIRRIRIERFRGIQSLTWYPADGVNVILGGGDVGKTTILDAIALLLNPTNSYTPSDADYWCRNVDAEFLIEGVMSLPDRPAISRQSRMNWPWEWNGKEPVVPREEELPEGAVHGGREAVYVFRVRGKEDLELAYEIVQPDDSVEHLSVGLRREIGVVRLAGDDRNDRDLRLVQGSGLDRLLADKGLRSRLGKELAGEKVAEHLKDDAKTALSGLEITFGERKLPTSLGLGITGGPGLSLNALVGLTAEKAGISLPLASWGAGTRRLAALAIADQLQGEHPITVVDEIERGLEPYRQRMLMKSLREAGGQVFVTTHSAAAISAAIESTLWYFDATGQIGNLPTEKVVNHQQRDPDTFLARLAVVCEGATEVGFMGLLLEKAMENRSMNLGVWVTDGGGHEATLGLLEALAAGRLTFAGVVDDENLHSGRWAEVKKVLGDLLLQWSDGCLEEKVIPAFPSAVLKCLIEDPEGERTGMRLRSLADRLEIPNADFTNISSAAGSNLPQLIVDAATGKVPDKYKDGDKHTKGRFKGHASLWFKSVQGGRELAQKVLELGAGEGLSPILLPFLNAIRKRFELSELEILPK